MADPSLLILLLSLVPIILHSGSFSLAAILAIQSTQPWGCFGVQEPLACLAFLIVLCHLVPNRTESGVPFLKRILSFILLALFVLFFLGGGAIVAKPTAPTLRVLIFFITYALAYGVIVWIKTSIVPLKTDQWSQKGWRILVPLTFLNTLVAGLRIAL